jgi:small subunit ribosomal protein S5
MAEEQEKQPETKQAAQEPQPTPSTKEAPATENKEGEEKKQPIVAPAAGGAGSRDRHTPSFDADAWKPKTDVGKRVKTGEITDIDKILDDGKRIMEPEIVDVLIPTAESELLLIGQSKGKFGGGQRRVFKQTQKKTKEGNKPSFATFAVVGDRKGHIGMGYGKSRETVPAREKATRKAKLNMINIRRGCGSWQCNCKEPHSIPFEVEGKCGSVKVKLMPAPKGTGLCAGSEIAKVLKLAGVEDVWSKTTGKTTSRINLTTALTQALKKLMEIKVQSKHKETLNIKE